MSSELLLRFGVEEFESGNRNHLRNVLQDKTTAPIELKIRFGKKKKKNWCLSVYSESSAMSYKQCFPTIFFARLERDRLSGIRQKFIT